MPKLSATAAIVVVVTYISIVVGELVPKRIGQLNPEPIARLVARPMQLLALLTRPFVLLLNLSTHGLLRLLGVKQDDLAPPGQREFAAGIYAVTVFIVVIMCWLIPAPSGAGFVFL